ncbi:GntR family transcriptional regulator [Kribbella sp. NPDC051587]|uniref:GntR family transcriptional regulator n=1 Tax=Kribbella sp. NPDC051587 TaxID=3364119 RepID=UPI00378BB69D
MTAGDELATPARTLLFAPLGEADVTAAVARRLRAVIGLGVLPNGARLPKEADLATQLGVTVFALREALATLREEGLVMTRAGKNGGSFVTYSPTSAELECDELLGLSTVELRDVGDWRQMLTAQNAALAAQRATAANMTALSVLVDRVAAATDAVEARRAHGRFQLELAAAAQSTRMTRAEFVAHEQIDWLFGLVLDGPDERRRCARALRKIAAAVEARNPRRARSAAEGHIAAMMEQLAQVRLKGLAERRQVAKRRTSRSLRTEVGAVVRTVQGLLRSVATDLAPVLTADIGFQQRRDEVRQVVLGRFGECPQYITGLALVAEVGLVPDRPRWIEWQLATGSGPVLANRHVLDPAREDYYDYASMEFFARPRETRKPWAAGPYIDSGGADDYVITLAAPIVKGGEFLGITCTDILVARLESWLSPMLAEAGESYLVNAESRVIVSNSPAFGVGDVLLDRADLEPTEFPGYGWSLLTRS